MRAVLAASLILATNCVSAGTVYHVDLVNKATSSIVSIEVARGGSTRYHALHFAVVPLPGGGESATVAIRQGDDGCLRDLRVGLADGRVVTQRGLDVCR